MLSIFFAGNATEDFWMSGTDLGTEGHFYWASTGHPFGLFSDWMNKMPDNFRNNEHCVQFHYSLRNDEGLKWNDNNCNREYKFICELVQ
jgi:Lectin C-type domain